MHKWETKTDKLQTTTTKNQLTSKLSSPLQGIIKLSTTYQTVDCL